MNKEDLSNSIFLIGPSCVGKSMLSQELGKRLNIPVVSIDDLREFVLWEVEGFIGPSKEKKQEFISTCYKDAKKDKTYKKNMQDEKSRQKQLQAIKNVANLYTRYVKMFDGLKQFKTLVCEHEKIAHNFHKKIEYIVGYAGLATLMVKKIVEVYDGPLIFDTPAMFGWEVDASKIGDEYKKLLSKSTLKLKLSKLNEEQSKILKQSNTVLLEPGLDYNIRNTERNSAYNKILLRNMDKYMGNADISITVNAMFYHPENKYFNKRSWFDYKEMETKRKLKNKCNISNICDEILSLMTDLKQGKDMQLGN